MATAADAHVQHAREAVYDVRWTRHRDQALIAITVVVILALVGATLITSNMMFAALAFGAPGVAATLRAVRTLLPASTSTPSSTPPNDAAATRTG
jgi:hypothetical protein